MLPFKLPANFGTMNNTISEANRNQSLRITLTEQVDNVDTQVAYKISRVTIDVKSMQLQVFF